MDVPEDNDPNNVSSEKYSSGASTTHGKTNPGWEHVSYKKEGKTHVYTCLHWTNSFKGGGINRMKQHLASILSNISSYKRVPHDVHHWMLELLNQIRKK